MFNKFAAALVIASAAASRPYGSYQQNSYAPVQHGYGRQSHPKYGKKPQRPHIQSYSPPKVYKPKVDAPKIPKHSRPHIRTPKGPARPQPDVYRPAAPRPYVPQKGYYRPDVQTPKIAARGGYQGYRPEYSRPAGYGGYGKGPSRPKYSYGGYSSAPQKDFSHIDAGKPGLKGISKPYQIGDKYKYDIKEKKGYGSIREFGDSYGDRSPDINKDRIYDRDESYGKDDFQTDDYDYLADINKDRIYDDDESPNKPGLKGIDKDKKYDEDLSLDTGSISGLGISKHGKGHTGAYGGYGRQRYAPRGRQYSHGYADRSPRYDLGHGPRYGRRDLDAYENYGFEGYSGTHDGAHGLARAHSGYGKKFGPGEIEVTTDIEVGAENEFELEQESTRDIEVGRETEVLPELEVNRDIEVEDDVEVGREFENFGELDA